MSMQGQSYLESEKAMGSSAFGSSTMMSMRGAVPLSVTWSNRVIGHFLIICFFSLIFQLVLGPESISGTIAYKKVMAMRKVNEEMMILTSRIEKINYLRNYGITVDDNEPESGIMAIMENSKETIAKKLDPEAALHQTWFQSYFEMIYFSVMTHVGLGYGDMVPTTFLGQAFVLSHIIIAWGFIAYVM